MKASESGRVTVKIFNLAGEQVRKPFDADVTANTWFQCAWKGDNEAGETVAAGVYVVSIQGAGIRSLRKVVVLK